MPIFEYRCGECHKKFEKILLSAGSAEPIECPRCGAVKAEKLVSRFATAAKGGGDDVGGDFGSDFGDDFGGDEGLGDEDSEGYGGPPGGEPWDGPPGDDDEDYDGDPGDEGGEEDD